MYLLDANHQIKYDKLKYNSVINITQILGMSWNICIEVCDMNSLVLDVVVSVDIHDPSVAVV